MCLSKRLRMLLLTPVILFLLCCQVGCAQRFEPTVESLSQYQCPEWFRDAKFGIYCHWNAQTASKSRHNGWYARSMYMEGSPAYKDHLRNWGHPSEVGYKDIIKAWQADKFNAVEWVDLFKETGAKYVVTMANHHDNFDMWDSRYQPRWNSTNYGPKVDVCAEIRRETLKAGLRWGVTTHLSRAYSWWQVNKDADTRGAKKGIPYDGNDPDYEDLYFAKVPDRSQLGGSHYELRAPQWSPQEYKDNWKNRMFDLIDRYHPDHFYFDASVPFIDDDGKTGLEVIAHFYNHNARKHGGNNEGVMVFKKIPDHGIFYPDIATVVMERGFSDKIEDEPRQTDNSIGPWFHTGHSSYQPDQIRKIIHQLADVVSKNNNLLLNVPPLADGSFDEQTVKTLKGIGQWLKRNGQAIYETRPWHVFGEENIRFTTKGETLYAILLQASDASVLLRSLKGWKAEDVASVQMLGGGDISWNLTSEGLEVKTLKYKEQVAYVFKINCTSPVSLMSANANNASPSVEDANQEGEKIGADGHGQQSLPEMIK